MELVLKHNRLIDQLINKNYDDFEQTYFSFLTTLNQIHSINPNFIINELHLNSLSTSHIKKNYYLAEFIRANGILNHPNIPLLNQLLTISIKLLESYDQKKVTGLTAFSFIVTVYDTIFHQVDLFQNLEIAIKNEHEINKKSVNLYFKLTSQLLNTRYFRLYNSQQEPFQQIIYFIMMNGWNATIYKKEFLILWDNVQHYIAIYGRDDIASESWINSFNSIQNKNI